MRSVRSYTILKINGSAQWNLRLSLKAQRGVGNPLLMKCGSNRLGGTGFNCAQRVCQSQRNRNKFFSQVVDMACRTIGVIARVSFKANAGDKRSHAPKQPPAIKKQITTDWKAHFPDLGIYKPM